MKARGRNLQRNRRNRNAEIIAALAVFCWIAAMIGDKRASLFSLLLLLAEWIALLAFLPVLSKSQSSRSMTDAALAVLLPAVFSLFACREYTWANLLCLLLCGGLTIGCVRFLPGVFRSKNSMILLTSLIPMLSFVLRCRLFARADTAFVQLIADRLCAWMMKLPNADIYIGRWIDRGWMSRPQGYGTMPFYRLMKIAAYANEAMLCVSSFLKRSLHAVVYLTAARWCTAFGVMAFLRQLPDRCVRVFHLKDPQGTAIVQMPCSFISLMQSGKVSRIMMLCAAGCLLVSETLPESLQNVMMIPAVMLLTAFTLQGAAVLVFVCMLKRTGCQKTMSVITGIWFFLWPLSALLTCLGLFETIVPIRMHLLLKEAKARRDAAAKLHTDHEKDLQS